jgi:SAM-dependent methyltransferase
MILFDSIKDYYEEKLALHGATPNGVDWNGAVSQGVRFQALSQVITRDSGEFFSIDDYGCGYGAYLGYLNECGWHPDYLGIDVSPEMIAVGIKQYPEGKFTTGYTSTRIANYAVASGIFNVALDVNREEWKHYIIKTLDAMHGATTDGFAFNCLTAYSDKELMRPHLYYGDPCFFFDYCKHNYSPHVALLHNYGLYEFTIIVKRSI